MASKKKKAEEPVTISHAVLSCSSKVDDQESFNSFPPLVNHRITSYCLITLDGPRAGVVAKANLKKKREGELVGGLVALMNKSANTRFVTMYGHNFTIPIILQRAFAHGLDASRFYSVHTYPNPDAKLYFEVTDWLTNKGRAGHARAEEYMEKLLGLPENPFGDIMNITSRKVLLRAQLTQSFRIACLFLRLRVVAGQLTRRKEQVYLKAILEEMPTLGTKTNKFLQQNLSCMRR